MFMYNHFNHLSAMYNILVMRGRNCGHKDLGTFHFRLSNSITGLSASSSRLLRSYSILLAKRRKETISEGVPLVSISFQAELFHSLSRHLRPKMIWSGKHSFFKSGSEALHLGRQQSILHCHKYAFYVPVNSNVVQSLLLCASIMEVFRFTFHFYWLRTSTKWFQIDAWMWKPCLPSLFDIWEVTAMSGSLAIET